MRKGATRRTALTLLFAFCFINICYLLYLNTLFCNEDIDVVWAEMMVRGTLGGCAWLEMFGAFAFLILAGGNVFKNMRTKQQRIEFLMLPASRMEKFAERALHVLLVNTICVVVAFLLADMVSLLLSLLIIPGYGQSITLILLKNVTYDAIDFMTIVGQLNAQSLLIAGLALWPMLSYVAWLHSVYVLGGTFFRRHHILLTTCVLAVVWPILMFIWGMFIIINFGDDMNLAMFIFAILLDLCIIGDYVLAYLIFKRMQAINNRWNNL